MNNKRLILPNSANSFIVEEMRQRLGEGHTVTIAFGGNSMLPTLDGNGDTIELAPLSQELRRGEVYLFLYGGHCVVHRLMRVRGDECTFRGDNCRGEEHVRRDAVLARLTGVIHSNGTHEDCSSPLFRRRSRRASRRRTLRNIPFKWFGRQNRSWLRWVYFVLLLLLMWAPVGKLGIPMNNFVLGIRADHLYHASVYLPITFFLMDFSLFQHRKGWLLWLAGIIVGLTTESVQYLLPYRGFDINDLLANSMGVTLGFFAVALYRSKHTKKTELYNNNEQLNNPTTND